MIFPNQRANSTNFSSSLLTHTNRMLKAVIVSVTAISVVVVGCNGERAGRSVENTAFETNAIIPEDVTLSPAVDTLVDDLKTNMTPFTGGEPPLPTELTAFQEELVSSEQDMAITIAQRYRILDERPSILFPPYYPVSAMTVPGNSKLLESSVDVFNYPYYTFRIDPSPESKDEVVIDSLTIRECVARGLVHNLSDSKYANNVVVTLQSKDGHHSGSWSWPLTMMPGEYAPYEIELTWDPTHLDPEYVNAFASRGERSHLREPKGNIQGSVNADFVEVADISRSFARNLDGSIDYYVGGVNPHLIVYNEQLFSLEEWDFLFEVDRGNDLISEDSFEYIFPTSLVLDNDIDAVASKFIPLESSDLYYVPETVFPNLYDDDIHHAIDDIKVYQAVIGYGDVLDVRELVPFRLQNEENSVNMTGPFFFPHDDFKVATSKTLDSSYILLLVPLLYPQVVDGVRTFSYAYSRPYDDYFVYVNSQSPIWIGKPNLFLSEENSEPIETTADSTLLESSQWVGNSCDRRGGLTREKHRVVSSARMEVIDHTLGYHGFFGTLESSQVSSDSVDVVMDTISAEDGFVRGLIHNLSNELFARDIVVDARTMDHPEASEQWHWPLTLQPGERAPFEIFLGGWKGSIPISQLNIEVTSKFSQQVDISRSFLIHGYNQGTVHRDDSTAQLETHIQFSEEYRHLDITVNGAFKFPHQHISLRTYLDRYNGVLCLEQMQYEDLPDECPVTFESSNDGQEKPPFHFVELHAEVEIPDSHPSLGSQIASLAINKLQAYAAMLDDNGKVADVRELIPFTSLYSQKAKKEMFWKVDSIPAPNLTSPNSLRLLFSLPYSEERRWDLRDSYQVWIGGSQESSR